MSVSCQTVRERIAQSIWDGSFPPGSPLPPIRKLAEMLSASPTTVHKAVGMLRADGIIASRPGVGLYIKPTVAGRTGRRLGFVAHYREPKEGENHIIHRSYLRSIVDSFRAAASAHGYETEYFRLTAERGLKLAEYLRGMNFAGIASLEVNGVRLLSDIRGLNLPLVSMDFNASEYGIPSITFDNAWGAFKVTQALIELGHRRIMGIGCHPWWVDDIKGFDPVDRERHDGYRLAMMNAGLEPELTDVNLAPGELEKQLAGIIESKPSCRALVCYQPYSAQRISQTLVSMGVSVPEDFSMVTFSNYRYEYAPGRVLSRINTDSAEMGRLAAECLIPQIERRIKGRSTIINVGMLSGDSMAPPPVGGATD